MLIQIECIQTACELIEGLRARIEGSDLNDDGKKWVMNLVESYDAWFATMKRVKVRGECCSSAWPIRAQQHRYYMG